MYYGIVGVSGIAFACSTELIPELNEGMKLVPFTEEFKSTMTAVMLLDFGACFMIERALKALFSDYRARDIAERRPDQVKREAARREAMHLAKERADDEKRAREVEEMERRLRERRDRIQGFQSGK